MLLLDLTTVKQVSDRPWKVNRQFAGAEKWAQNAAIEAAAAFPLLLESMLEILAIIRQQAQALEKIHKHKSM